VGNPYLPMNLYISDAMIDGKPADYGMEIGIYDDDLCVGSAVIIESLDYDNSYLSMIVGRDDPTTWEKDGYTPGSQINVRIFDGDSEYVAETENIVFESQGTAVMSVNVNTLPANYKLYANYPNPFNPITTISYDLAKEGEVSLIVYNILGEIVTTMVSGYQEAGSYQVIWDATNDTGDNVASGVYFFKLQAGDFIQLNKAILLK